MKRGQVSIEYVAIFGFVFLMMIPLILIFFDQSGNVENSIAANHLRNLAIKITDKAETVYYLGNPSKTTVKTYLPDKVEYVNITDRTVIFGYRTVENTVQEIISVSQVNITGNITTDPGIHYIEIESTGDIVLIRES